MTVGGWMLGLIVMLWPVSVEATCVSRDVTGSWTIEQRNTPLVQINIQQQSGYNIQGSATYLSNDGKFVRGTLDGSMGANSIQFKAHWENGTVGIYRADFVFIRGDGSSITAEYFSGGTFEEGHPETNAAWTSRQRPYSKCIATDDGLTANNFDFGIPPRPQDPVALGRTQAPPKVGPINRPAGPLGEVPFSTPTSQKASICALAASARARHAADQASLEAQCRALGGQP
jgi:hypothetical protein